MISSIIRCDKEFSSSLAIIKEQLKADAPLPIVVNGLCDGAASAFLTELCSDIAEGCKNPILVLVKADDEIAAVVDKLTAVGIRAMGYKARDLVFYNISASHDRERERLSVLSALISGRCRAVVTTPYAASQFTVPRDILCSSVLSFGVGDELSPSELCNKLSRMGFRCVELVESAGQFARRGGIVDFYPDADSGAIRVEFFGDEVDRIVNFDAQTQRATRSLGAVDLKPALEVVLTLDAKGAVANEINALISAAADGEVKDSLRRELSALGTENLDARDKYLSLIYPERESLFTYIESLGRAAVFVIGTAGCEDSLKSGVDAISERVESLSSKGLLRKSGAAYISDAAYYKRFLSESAAMHINAFSGARDLGELSGIIGFRTRRTIGYADNPKLLSEDLLSFKKGGYKVIIQCENRSGAQALYDELTEGGYTPSLVTDGGIDILKMPTGSISVCVGDEEGFELLTPRIAVISMKKDEGRAVMEKRRQNRIMRKLGGEKSIQRLMSHTDLKVGDYVVHANYGIGLFEGISTERVDGVVRDYITVRYAGTDKLLVPCDRLALIGKYIGQRDNDGTVKLSKMGGSEWQRAKSRAKSAARDIAKSLIELYARRQRTPGFAFSADSELEEQFASEFGYEETGSQLQAIDEIKRDMMNTAPMNRLLLGDVGFGKTEVALRAAFKAVMCGKQVAFLVPTTILALQHYTTAVSRMRGYPVNVEMISRFKTPREQAAILKKLAEGRIDIIVGTHKLLSKNVEFRDLGLLIVDEEQRFGVAQKERLKERIAAGVDVLTLSATPIPRTLNMAMNGISDMSILDEAPGERRPVQTYVLEHDDIIITEAMRRELARGGQVLYLYNKIESIIYKADIIARALPDARVAYAHGQMERDELEDIWQALVGGEIDILVCTTIVETGVDLPNANTLIIENADRMGLSQLHQIRGRVGRSPRQAYAYFTYRPGKALSEIAEKRLAAVREYAEFGAGFNIALRDLEIRGAGNLLGAEQHGYIDGVGYDLYVKLLSEAVLTEQGKALPDEFECTVDYRTDAHIPEYYVHSSAGRMEMYKKISLISCPEDMDELFDEMTDRYGDMPRSVERLLKISLCRALGTAARITKASVGGGKIAFYTEKLRLDCWSEILDKHKGRMVAMPDGSVVYRLSPSDDVTDTMTSIIKDYHAAACDT